MLRCSFTACRWRAALVWLPMAWFPVALCSRHRTPAAIATMRRLVAG